jgi:hypothetical protein
MEVVPTTPNMNRAVDAVIADSAGLGADITY